MNTSPPGEHTGGGKGVKMRGMVKPSIRGSPAVVSMILARRGTAKDDQRERNQRLSRSGGPQFRATGWSMVTWEL